MVGEHELDGVLLATWPTLHREQILGCLEQRVSCRLSGFGHRDAAAYPCRAAS